MQKIIFTITLILVSIYLAGCSATSASLTSVNEPPLVIQKFFNGQVKAHGVLLNRQGGMTRSFSIDMYGKWYSNKEGILAEKIYYNDGEIQLRKWHFMFSDPHHFIATAKDAVGIARGTQYGNMVHMYYILNVLVDKKTYAIQFDDNLYMTQGAKLFNRTTISKFGFDLGEIIITYNKK